MGPYATALFHVAAFPRGRDYFIPVGDGKVLISLATHLDQADIAEMAVARVIQMVPKWYPTTRNKPLVSYR